MKIPKTAKPQDGKAERSRAAQGAALRDSARGALAAPALKTAGGRPRLRCRGPARELAVGPPERKAAQCMFKV